METPFPDPRDLLEHAGWVRRLARALVGEDRADDLAQQTMLRALEKPPRWGGDPRPWLGRVARNLAWSERRAEARRARRESRTPGAGLPETPDELLARSEAHRLLVENLLELEEPVRHLLILRYFEELSPAQIARQLGAPASTVRAQLSRGLERLRTRVRRRHGEGGLHSILMLGAPAAGGALSGTSLASTILAMSTQAKLLSVLGLAAAFLLANLFLREGGEEALSPDELRNKAPELAAAVETVPEDPMPVAAAEPVAEKREAFGAVGPPESAQPGENSQLIRIRGRCVAEESGSPLAACIVKIHGWTGNDRRLAEYGPVDWQDPDPVVSDQEGRFELSFPPMPPFQFGLDIQGPGRAPRTARWGELPAGAVVELGEIPMAPGVVLRGRLVDTAGTPIPRIGVGLSGLPLPLEPGMAANDSRSGSTGETGEFRLASLVPAGSWRVEVSGRGWKLMSSASVTIPVHVDEFWTEVVVERRPSISGVVVDEEGAPAPGVRLMAELHPKYHSSWGSGRTAIGRSDETGRFMIYSEREDDRQVQILVTGGAFEPVPDDRALGWGETGVVLHVKKTYELPIRVIEKGTGRPVESYAIELSLPGSGGQSTRRSGRPAKRPDGRAIVRGLWSGTNEIRILPPEGGLGPSGPVEVLAGGGELEEITIRLERQQSLEVRVVHRDGSPVAGSTVMVAPPKPERPVGTQTREVTITSSDQTVSMSFDGSSSIFLHEWSPASLGRRTTGPDGKAVFGIPVGVGAVRIEVNGRHLPSVLESVAYEGRPLRIEVDEGAVIEGRVLFWEGPRKGEYGVSLGNRDGAQIALPRGSDRIDADGAFRLAGLLPGVYQLRLWLYSHYRHGGGSSGSWSTLPPLLGLVEVAEGEVAEVELDARSLRPGSVRGRVLVDGQVPGGVFLSLFLLHPEKMGFGLTYVGAFGQYAVAEDGSFAADSLPPGEYRPSLVLDVREGEEGGLPYSGTFQVEPGGQTELQIDFQFQTIRVRLVRAGDGQPLRNTGCGFGVPWSWLRMTRTDEDGWFEIRPAPPGEIRVTLAEGSRLVGSVEAEEGQALTEVVLEVSAG